MHNDKTTCPSPNCPICSRQKPVSRKLTLKERIEKQRKDNLKASDRAYEYIKGRVAKGDFLLHEYSAVMIFTISLGTFEVKTRCDNFTIQATSGKDDYINNNSIESQSASYKGVTPVGKYIIKPFEFSDPNIIVDAKRNYLDGADWGDWRVRMHNKTDEGFNYFGRNDFFLHCGSIAGSAGCIDIGGGITGNTNTDRVAKIIAESDKNILVLVQP